MSDVNLGTVRTQIGLDLKELERNVTETKRILDSLGKAMENSVKQAAMKTEQSLKLSFEREARLREEAARRAVRQEEAKQERILRAQQRGEEKRLRQAQSAARSLVAAGAGLSLGGAAAAGGLLESALTFENLQKGLVAVMGSAESARVEMERLQQAAKLPGVGFREGLQMSTQLQAAGLSATTARKAIVEFGNALTTVGKGKAEMDGVALALSQIASKGKVSAEEINQLAERVPQIRMLMKQAFGTANTETIQKAGIAPAQFIEALLKVMERLPRAAGGTQNALDNFKDSMDRLSISLGKGLLPLMQSVTEKLTPMAERWADALKKMSPEELETKMKGFLAVIAAPAALSALATFAKTLGNIATAMKWITGSAAGAGAGIAGAGVVGAGLFYRDFIAGHPGMPNNDNNPEILRRRIAEYKKALSEVETKLKSPLAKQYPDYGTKLQGRQSELQKEIAEMQGTLQQGTGVLPPMAVNPRNIRAMPGRPEIDAEAMAKRLEAQKQGFRERERLRKQAASDLLAATKREAENAVRTEQERYKSQMQLQQEMERLGVQGFDLERLMVSQEIQRRERGLAIDAQAEDKLEQIRRTRDQVTANRLRDQFKSDSWRATVDEQQARLRNQSAQMKDITMREIADKVRIPQVSFDLGGDYGQMARESELEGFKNIIASAMRVMQLKKEEMQMDIEAAAQKKSLMDEVAQWESQTGQKRTSEYLAYLDEQIKAEQNNTERYRALYAERYQLLKPILEEIVFGKKSGKETVTNLADGISANQNILKNTIRDVATTMMVTMGNTFRKGFGGFFGDIVTRTLTSLISNALESAIEAAFRKKKSKPKGFLGGLFGDWFGIMGAVLNPIGAILGAVNGGGSGGGSGDPTAAIVGGGVSAGSRSVSLPAMNAVPAGAGGRSAVVNIHLGGVSVNSKENADYLVERMTVEAQRQLRTRY